MIRNILFDVYGTLISTGNGSIEATQKILKNCNTDLDAKKFYKDWKKYHRKHIDELKQFVTEEEIFIQDLDALFKQYKIEQNAKEQIKPMIDSLYGRKAFEDTIPALESLQSYHLAIGSTSDTEPLQYNLKLNQLPIERIFTSEMLRAYKPSAEFFTSILCQLGWKVEETVYVGDSLIDDIQGPKGIGMRAILLDRTDRYQGQKLSQSPDAIINSLSELKTIIPSI